MSDNITLPREVVKLALDHIEWYIENERGGRFAEVREAAEALRTALAAPEPEPVRVEPTPPITRFTCGFVDVRFDGERWFCGKCGERMPANYEAMVKHYSGDRDYLELMQRKAAFKIGRDKT